jgi:hypothetical protein
MMRSWENRPDTQVIDEPFYAHYLTETGIDHPARAEVIASQSADWREVARNISEAPIGTAIHFQKHMTLHLLPEMDLGWAKSLRHYFLIRDPLWVVNSYVKKRPHVNSDDIGVERQLSLFQELRELTARPIPILDANDVASQPRLMMERLCERLEVPFCEEMLRWPAGPRESDGCWGKLWYHAVEESTGFAPFEAPAIEVTPEQRAVAEASRPAYLELYRQRLKFDG